MNEPIFKISSILLLIKALNLFLSLKIGCKNKINKKGSDKTTLIVTKM